MKPLIKWPGGKSSELKRIEKLIPPFKRYIEPFFGGGALLFDLDPKKAVINDISVELIQFYKLLKNNNKRESFKNELMSYVNNWEKIETYMKHFGDDFIKLYNKYKTDKISYMDFSNGIIKLFRNKIIPFNGLFSKKFCLDRDNLLKRIQDNVISKLGRIRSKIDVNNYFSDKEIMKNIETAFRSGFYKHFRDIMNWIKSKKIKTSKEKEVANYYFIREFCYGGMFRFNSSGDFNVPYGGLAYNAKDFRRKVDYIFSNQVSRLFKKISIKNMDFEEFIGKLETNKDDFMFLDPPYDSEFSDYEEKPFTRKDQERLANLLSKTEAKFILVIKETPFILSLYKGRKNINILKFNKEYSFNIKERNPREVNHLIVHNFKTAIQSRLM